MRLRDGDLSTKVVYQGQELYSHIVFVNQAAGLANMIGDTNSFSPTLYLKSAPRRS